MSVLEKLHQLLKIVIKFANNNVLSICCSRHVEVSIIAKKEDLNEEDRIDSEDRLASEDDSGNERRSSLYS